jgi:hypothetical protein
MDGGGGRLNIKSMQNIIRDTSYEKLIWETNIKR